MDDVTCPRPFKWQFVLRRLVLAMINLHKFTIFGLFLFIYYKDMKGNAKCINLGVLGARG